MASRVVGIVLTGKDLATGVVRTIERSTSTSFKVMAAATRGFNKVLGGSAGALSRLGRVGGNALKTLGISTISLNQGLGLLQRTFQGLDRVLGAPIRKALEFRGAGDEVTTTMSRFGREIEILAARFGDAFIPGLLAIVDTLRPMVAQTTQWLIANQKLIASGIVDFLMRVGRIIAQVVIPAVGLMVNAFNGLKLIFLGLEIAFTSFVSFSLRSYALLAEAAIKLSRALGLSKVAEGLQGVSTELEVMASKFDVHSAAIQTQVAETQQEMKRVAQTTEEIGRKADEFVGKMAVNAQIRLRNATTGTNTSLEDQRKAAEEAGKAAEKAAEEQKRAAQERMDTIDKQTETINGHIVRTFEQVAFAGGRLEDRLRSAFQGLAQTIITDLIGAITKSIIKNSILQIGANAAVGQSAAAAGSAGLPFPANLFVAAASAAAIGALILGFKSQVPGFAEGGLVRGPGLAITGRDTVPALLEPGELVIPKDQVRSLMRVMGQPTATTPTGTQRFQRGGFVRDGAHQGAMAAGRVEVTVKQDLVGFPDRATSRRWIRDVIAPELRALERNNVRRT